MRRGVGIVKLGILLVVALPLLISCKGKEEGGISEHKGRSGTQGSAVPLLPELSKARGVSLKVLQERASECVGSGKCPDEILRIGGVRRLLGYVIDEENRDIILVGNVDGSLPPLHLEDFVIALRSAWRLYAIRRGNTYYYSAPGCSIDPDPRVLGMLGEVTKGVSAASNQRRVRDRLNEWRGVCDLPQQVKVLGIPYDSRFAKVMVDADYDMKRLVDGSVVLGIEGLSSLTDMTMDIVRQEMESGRTVSVPLHTLNRFWFHAGENSLVEDKGVVLLDRSEVRLSTEAQFLSTKGQVVGSGRADSLAERFAQNFSAKYGEIAKAKPIYAELEGLFRFVALATVMQQKDAPAEARLNLEYLMNQYPIAHTRVPRTLPGIANVKEFRQRTETQGGYTEMNLWLPSCGGVTIDIADANLKIVKDSAGKLASVKRAVLRKRNSTGLLYWDLG